LHEPTIQGYHPFEEDRMRAPSSKSDAAMRPVHAARKRPPPARVPGVCDRTDQTAVAAMYTEVEWRSPAVGTRRRMAGSRSLASRRIRVVWVFPHGYLSHHSSRVSTTMSASPGSGHLPGSTTPLSVGCTAPDEDLAPRERSGSGRELARGVHCGGQLSLPDCGRRDDARNRRESAFPSPGCAGRC